MGKKVKNTAALGRGLGALLPSSGSNLAETAPNVPLKEVLLADIESNPFQPRTEFDQQALQELAASIKELGLIQPITVRKLKKGYQLISGERRWRAAGLAGLEKITAYILDVGTNAQMLQMAIVENIQRENLNPLEVALGYQRLIEECGLTQEQVADKVGKERSTVANFLRLLRLPASIQASLKQKQITMGHARALLGVTDQFQQQMLFDQVVSRDMSVRATEQLIRDMMYGAGKQKSDAAASKKSPSKAGRRHVAEAEDMLRRVFGTKAHVKITNENTFSGQIEVQFFSRDELERILELVQTIPEN